MCEREQIRADIKWRLNSYREIQAERLQLLDELKRLEALMASPASPNMDGMPRGDSGPSNPVENMVIQHETLERRYKAKIDKMREQQAEIEDLIEGLDPVERRLARFRYIDCLTWEDVCDMMAYSWRQTHRIHGRMLDKLVNTEIERRKAQKCD